MLPRQCRSAAVAFLAAALPIWAGACTCSTPLDGLRFACATDPECGSGYLCRGGECVPADAPPADGGDPLDGGGEVDAGCARAGGCADPECGGAPCGPDGLRCQGGSCLCSGNGAAAEALEDTCNDATDNDCDGLIDCAEAACDLRACGPYGRRCAGGSCACSGNGGLAQTTETACSDGLDNDCNGLVDCADSRCEGLSCGAGGRACVPGACRCSGNGGAVEPGESTCGDGHDNDCDELTDCADPHCAGASCGASGRFCSGTTCACSGNGGPPQPVETGCLDGRDNDCDGLVDCADPDCLGRACNPARSEMACVAADAGSCVCGNNTIEVDPAHSGRASVIEAGGGPAMLYNDEGGGAGARVWYSQCQSGCTGAAPVFSPPISIGVSQGTMTLRPMLVSTGGSGLAALWRNTQTVGGTLYYAECAGGCSTLSAWVVTQAVASAPVSGSAAGLAVHGALRAAVGEGASPNAALYAECGASCAVGSGSWSYVTLPAQAVTGASVALTDLGGGVVRRSAVWGSGGGTSPMLYGECASSCTLGSSWTTVQLAPGLAPELVLDSAGLPRVFSHSGYPPANLRVSRCTQRPCTVAGNWTAQSALVPGAGYVTGGVAADGRTWFTTSSSGSLGVGIETATGYAVSTLGWCGGGSTWGDSAAGWLGPLDRWRLGYPGNNRMRYRHELP